MTFVFPFIVVAFAGLLHASFQLGVSLLTLLSGHSLGSGRSHQRIAKLTFAYFSGAAVVTILLFSTAAYFGIALLEQNANLAWLLFSVLNMVIGLSVIVFYYRREKGTGLWIPRSMAEYLTNRTKKTKQSAEAFTLGAGGVLAEVPFIIGPLSLAVLYSVSQLAVKDQISSLVIYCFIALAPLWIIALLVNYGYNLATIQRWRENNKLFLQYTAGSGLIILGSFVFVDQFVARILL